MKLPGCVYIFHINRDTTGHNRRSGSVMDSKVGRGAGPARAIRLHDPVETARRASGALRSAPGGSESAHRVMVFPSSGPDDACAQTAYKGSPRPGDRSSSRTSAKSLPGWRSPRPSPAVTENGLYVTFFYEAAALGNSSLRVLPLSSLEVRSSFYSRSRRWRGSARRRMRGVEGWGAPSTRRLSDGSPGDIRAHPPSEPSRDTRGPTRLDRSGRHPVVHGAEWAPSRRVHGLIAQERKEDPGQSARERDHGDALAAPGGEAASPLPQRRGSGIVETAHGDGGLDQQPLHPARACCGDPPPPRRLPRAQLPGDQPQGGLDLVGPAKALDVVDRRHERRRRHRSDARHTLQPPYPLVRLRDRDNPLVRVRQLLLQVSPRQSSKARAADVRRSIASNPWSFTLAFKAVRPVRGRSRRFTARLARRAKRGQSRRETL